MSKDNLILNLNTRSGLPDALRVLTEEFPRDIWTSHENFDGLVRFWLDRHIMFRRLVTTLQEDVLKLESKSLDPEHYRHRLAKLGNLFVSELHTHHNIEDHQFFPLLQQAEIKLAHGFEILDHDHHALDTHLETFTSHANKLLKSPDNKVIPQAKAFYEKIIQIEAALNRHLIDEEELVIPVILKHGLKL